jgi:hypothetical protein
MLPQWCSLLRNLAVFCAVAVLLSACGGKTAATYSAHVPVAYRVLLEEVPFHPQEKYQCGPAALAMMLGWSGLDVTPEDLAAQIYTPGRKGSLQSDVIAGARRHGRIAYPVRGMDVLLAELNGGRPVLVLLNLAFSWYPRWHYAVVFGYDRQEELVYLRSGTRAREILSFRVFRNLWSRSNSWGLLVLPPGEMPVHAEEVPWLEAAAGLELSGEPQAAAAAFRGATARWPESFEAWIGLGNNLYALRDLQGAIDALQRAVIIRPDAPVTYNNLANALAGAGRYEEALRAARQAVRLGGPFLDTFLATERELLRDMNKASAEKTL